MRHRRIVQAASTALIAGALLMGPASAAQAVTTTPTVRILSGTACSSSIYCFSPARKAVVPNTTVRWTNRTNAYHTVSRCSNVGIYAPCPVSGGTGRSTGFGSGTLLPGGAYRFHFVGKGTYVYYCKIHGYAALHGTITVT